tara:strand:- start:156 stop:434 length:279 start_codon:yes stop_codon:yes gene_type:complete
MGNLFKQKQPLGNAVREIKKMIIEQFLCKESAIISVAELRCHETNCPPVETIITIRHDDSSQDTWRIHKPINQVTNADIHSLSQQELSLKED